MDVQLQELVDKIKKDGVEAANIQAEAIIKEAEDKAAGILASARQEAETVIKNGRESAERDAKAAEDAIRQAARNLLISFRDGVTAELDAVIKTETSAAYDASVLKAALPDVIKAWAAGKNGDNFAVLLPDNQISAVKSFLESALKEKIAAGLEISAGSDIPGGFRIAEKDGSAYYDFSAEAVAEMFSSYLNPKVSALMKAAVKEL